MDWHIMTSSKGGVGKTLLSLMLLAYHLEEKKDGSVLFLDLNGMNTDSMAMLTYNRSANYKKTGEKANISLKTNEKIYHNGFEQIQLKKSYTFNNNKQNEYIVGWSVNPFELCNPIVFADLLVSIKTEAPDKIKEMGLQQPLKYIIIDTNYHFCNIFGSDDSHYTVYDSLLKNENFNIWFLWVYRQLEKLIYSKENQNEAQIVKTTADLIETHLTNKNIPFQHVFSPAALVSSQSKEGRLTGTLKSLLDAMLKQRDYLIPEFETLEKLSTEKKYVSFEEWVENLYKASNNIETFKDRSLSFLPILMKAIELIDSKYRPENIIPLSVYQPTLRQYTDKDRGDIVNTIRNLKVYKHFSKLIKL